MQDPAQLYRLETDTDLDGLTAPTLVVALSGFMDAGHAQRLLVEHLMSTLEHSVVATFDVDQILDYRGRRPPMVFARDRWAEYADPSLVLYRVLDDAGVPFLLLAGPEPDYQWERVVEAIRQLMRAFGVRRTVDVHGIPMAVPHTRPCGATFHGTRDERRAGHLPVFGEVNVPGSLSALLELRLGESGEDAFGFALHIPHYLAQSEYAPAAVEGLRLLSGATGLTLPSTALEVAAAETVIAVEKELAGSAEAAEIVASLERQHDARPVTGGLVEVDDTMLPSAEELGAEFEAFLRSEGDEGSTRR